MHLVEPDVFDEPHRALVLFPGLSGEPDDHVGANGNPGDGATYLVDQIPILPRGVAATHPGQHLVVAGLDRQVDVLAHLVKPRHRPHDPPAHEHGVGGEEPYAGEPLDGIQRVEQVRQVLPVRQVVAIGVHGLPQEGDFLDSPGDQVLHLGHDLRDRSADLPASPVWDDAEGAHQVAAMDDGDVAADRRPGRRQAAYTALPVQPHALSQQVQQRTVLLGPHEGVDEGEGGAKAMAPGPHHAPHQGHHAVGPGGLEGLHRPQGVGHLVLGVLSDHAGVEDYDVGVLGPVHRTETELLQGAGEPLRVGDVHLAAYGPYVVAFHGLRRSLKVRYGGGNGIRTHEPNYSG